MHFKRTQQIGSFLLAACCVGVSSAQCILEGFTDDKALETTLFGSSVDIQGDRMVVGAMLDTGVEWGTGAVHVFERQADTWGLVKVIFAPDGDLTDMLGNAVALDGDQIIAGAWWDEERGTRSGSAYIFENTVGLGWELAAKLVAFDGMPEATFGRTVAIQGDYAVVGSPLHSEGAPATGAAYAYWRDEAGVWSEGTKIVPSDLADADRFGLSLDMDGRTVAIGSPWADEERGKVYIFELDEEGGWTEIAILQPDGISPGDQFGFDVAIEGDQLLIGAYQDDCCIGEGDVPDTGSVWCFEKSDAGWELSQSPLTAPELSVDFGAEFGVSVAISGDTALIGARFASTLDGPSMTGAVVSAVRTSAGWSLGEPVFSQSPQTEGEFGWQVALDGNYGVISALYEDVAVDGDGRSYVIGLADSVCGGLIGDLNGDGFVNGADLTILLASWGACLDPLNCPADLDGNFVVDGADLTILLANWSGL